MLVYPLLILVLYGTKGYIAGISNEYYHIPEIKRSLFLNFENSKRGMKQFVSFPRPYIILGFMIFVFVWAWISLIQTISFFFTGKLAISTMSSYFVYITLFFGIIGYFTRFWGRKIKYRGIDIYFAAYLMAAIGLNVFVIKGIAEEPVSTIYKGVMLFIVADIIHLTLLIVFPQISLYLPGLMAR